MNNQHKVPPFLSRYGDKEKTRLMDRLILWQQDEVAELFSKWLIKKIESMYKEDEKAVADSTTEFEMKHKLIRNLNRREVYREILNILKAGESDE